LHLFVSLHLGDGPRSSTPPGKHSGDATLLQYAIRRTLGRVKTLSDRDASALLDLVAELHHLDEPAPFPLRLLASLDRLIPSDEVGYSELEPRAQASALQVWHLADGEDEVIAGDGFGTREERELWWLLRSTHPVCGYRTASGDWTTPYKASDFATLREFRRTAIYDAFYRGVLDRWLDVGLPATATRTRVFIFGRRGGPDFDERDKLVLELLQPHLAARAEAVATAADAAAALAAVEEDGASEANRVVLCSGEGVIEFAAPSARGLLKRYLVVENGRVPTEVLYRRELVLARASRRLHVRIARTGALYVLVLDERDVRVERLSAREREVLERVACGEVNDEIALALGIAPATVAKHLEHVYWKLGVPNRTAAAAVLNGLSGGGARSHVASSDGTLQFAVAGQYPRRRPFRHPKPRSRSAQC
jgi:DNA-binding CsgD family transcriptional regulator